MAKAMSYQRLVALIYHGWTLKSAWVDKASGLAAEYYLEWDLPESARRPTQEEVLRFALLSVVDDVFEITGRGIVITPGFPRSEEKKYLKVGDFVVLHDRASEASLAEVRGFEFFSPPNPKCWPLLLGSGLTKKEVRVGMDVWFRKKEEANQSLEPTRMDDSPPN